MLVLESLIFDGEETVEELSWLSANWESWRRTYYEILHWWTRLHCLHPHSNNHQQMKLRGLRLDEGLGHIHFLHFLHLQNFDLTKRTCFHYCH